MITFKSLEGISLERLCETLNNAFSQYFVKINFTFEMLKNKCNEEDFNPRLSVGAFDGEQLVGVILHGFRTLNSQKTVYNMATGVVLTHRGQQLTKRMYQYVIPKLKESAITNMQLEVIQANVRALKIYESVGFCIHCSYDCFKQKADEKFKEGIDENEKIVLQSIETINHPKVESFYEVMPSWSNDLTAIDNNPKGVLSNIGAFLDGKLIGFLSFNLGSGRIKLLVVDPNHRRIGVGQRLLAYAQKECQSLLTVINIDDKGTETMRFLKQHGFELTVSQYEMRANI